MTRARSIGRAAAALFTLAAGCGGGASSSAPPAAPTAPTAPSPTSAATVTVRNNAFAPGDVTVSRGGTVTWRWDSCSGDGYGGQSCTAHSVTFDQGNVASPTQESGAYTRTFTATGTYPYHCAIHGSSMSGRVVVP